MAITVPSQFPLAPPKFAFIVEAPNKNEIDFQLAQKYRGLTGWPLVGASGRTFNQLLTQAKVDRSECYIGQVFNFQLPDNKLQKICVDINTVRKQWSELEQTGKINRLPFFARAPLKELTLQKTEGNSYLPQEYWGEVIRLWEELRSIVWVDESGSLYPILIPLGNTALWAVTGKLGIEKARGAFSYSVFNARETIPFTVFPTYHPQAANYDGRRAHDILSDLQKLTSETLEKSVAVTCYIPQTVGEVEQLFDNIERVALEQNLAVAFDIETPNIKKGETEDDEENEDEIENDSNVEIDATAWPPRATRADRYVEMISFAVCTEPAEGFVVPFYDPRKSNGCYWSEVDHIKVALRVAEFFYNSAIAKTAQNGTFDYNYILDRMGIGIANWKWDTRLLRKARYPDMSATLAAQSADELNFSAWKLGQDHVTIKKDD
jgi:hypothetical protein